MRTETLNNPVFPSIGKCIYCGSSGVPLTREHVIPRGLFGTTVFLDASCSSCQQITSAFETEVLQSMLGMYRARHNFPSYKKRRKAAKRFNATFQDQVGNRSVETLDATDYPSMYLVPVMPPAGILMGANPSDTNPPMELQLRGDPAALEQLIKKSAGQSVGLTNEFPYGAFCRMLAKIAHGFAIAHTDPASFEPFLPPLILGKSAHLSHYVGGVHPDAPAVEPGTVSLWIEHREETHLVAILLQLAGFPGMPAYEVIAGKLVGGGPAGNQHGFWTQFQQVVAAAWRNSIRRSGFR